MSGLGSSGDELSSGGIWSGVSPQPVPWLPGKSCEGHTVKKLGFLGVRPSAPRLCHSNAKAAGHESDTKGTAVSQPLLTLRHWRVTLVQFLSVMTQLIITSPITQKSKIRPWPTAGLGLQALVPPATTVRKCLGSLANVLRDQLYGP